MYDQKKIKERTSAIVDMDDEGIKSKNDSDVEIEDSIEEHRNQTAPEERSLVLNSSNYMLMPNGKYFLVLCSKS